MQWSYAQAGLSLPRLASDQFFASTPVAVNAMQPGDLLVYAYDPKRREARSTTSRCTSETARWSTRREPETSSAWFPSTTTACTAWADRACKQSSIVATGSTVRQVQRLVGRYDLIEQVASGKGRALWRGHDVVLDRPVGILMLDRDHPHATAVRAAALRAARIEHPSILRVVDADLDDGRVLVVTRWLIGAHTGRSACGRPTAVARSSCG